MVAIIESWIDWFQDYVAEGEDPSEPASDIYVPIIDHRMDSIRIAEGSDEVVGLVVSLCRRQETSLNVFLTHTI